MIEQHERVVVHIYVSSDGNVEMFLNVVIDADFYHPTAIEHDNWFYDQYTHLNKSFYIQDLYEDSNDE